MPQVDECKVLLCFPDLHWEVVDDALGKGNARQRWSWEAYHTVGVSALYLQSVTLICETTYKLFCLGEVFSVSFRIQYLCGYQTFDLLGIICHVIFKSCS